MNANADHTTIPSGSTSGPAGICWPSDIGAAMQAGSVGERCPILPMEFQCVIRPDAAEEKTAGGIILTKQTVEADEIAADEGTLVAVSPLAFTYAEWPEGARKPEVGDRVVFQRYAGFLRRPRAGKDGSALRILPDKAILAVIEE